MSTTTVRRGLGDRPGPEISDPLLTHEQARLARGRYQLDVDCASRRILRCAGYYTEAYEPGMLVEVTDRRGVRRRGMVDEVEDVLTRGDERTFTADTSLVIEVVR
jgi:hypothetical protein